MVRLVDEEKWSQANFRGKSSENRAQKCRVYAKQCRDGETGIVPVCLGGVGDRSFGISRTRLRRVWRGLLCSLLSERRSTAHVSLRGLAGLGAGWLNIVRSCSKDSTTLGLAAGRRCSRYAKTAQTIVATLSSPMIRRGEIFVLGSKGRSLLADSSKLKIPRGLKGFFTSAETRTPLYPASATTPGRRRIWSRAWKRNPRSTRSCPR